ncbi:hypothetical protein HDU96_002412 [Phlyctochytrium bullatum]|nr:hypothetical protein HDU96_002412 [Phlyctochytrium bullatum]
MLLPLIEDLKAEVVSVKTTLANVAQSLTDKIDENVVHAMHFINERGVDGDALSSSERGLLSTFKQVRWASPPWFPALQSAFLTLNEFRFSVKLKPAEMNWSIRLAVFRIAETVKALIPTEVAAVDDFSRDIDVQVRVVFI